jgi:hypothetical protein
MKLRLSDNALRFRLTAEELDALRQGEAAHCRLAGGDVYFAASVQPVAGRQGGMRLEQSGGTLRLQVTARTLDSLAALGPSKGGIETTQGPLTLSLEVDLRSARDRARSLTKKKNNQGRVKRAGEA